MSFQHIAVLGPGLLGGSILMACGEYLPDIRRSAWARRREASDLLGGMGIADLASDDLAAAVDGADLIILATPVEVMGDLAAQLAELPLRPGCVITDVGSVKAMVMREVGEALAGAPDIRFIGSHPMAGSEQAGIEAASPELFQDAACLVTTEDGGDEDGSGHLARITEFWQSLGCRVRVMLPDDHDRLVAAVSHLPHVAACALASVALGEGHLEERAAAAGGGLRDSTRIASGDPELWAGILASNRSEVVPAVRALHKKLGEVLEFLEAVDEVGTLRFLREAKRCRDRADIG